MRIRAPSRSQYMVNVQPGGTSNVVLMGNDDSQAVNTARGLRRQSHRDKRNSPVSAMPSPLMVLAP